MTWQIPKYTFLLKLLFIYCSYRGNVYLCIELIVYYIVDMTIAVDFDGTIVEHRYPEIGKERPFAIQTLKMLQHLKVLMIILT